MAELPDRILQHIGRATSQQPARAEEVRAALGLAASDFDPALQLLARDCRINTAQIQRRGDAAPWLAIWPTGVCLPSAAWNNNRHSVLFPRDAPIVPALRQASAPRVRQATQALRAPKQEESPMHTRHKRGELPALALAALRAAPAPLTVAELAQELDTSVENTRQLIYRLVDKELVENIGVRLGGTAHQFRATGFAAEPATPAQSAPDEVVAASPQLAHAAPKSPPDQPDGPAAPRLEFALWDSGALDIYDGDGLVQLAPADTARLARLLGVPGNNAYPFN